MKAHIFNVTQMGNDVGIIYAVTVGGKPIPAITAANDMRLMTASEVIAELGHPILSKAERKNSIEHTIIFFFSFYYSINYYLLKTKILFVSIIFLDSL